MEKVESEDGSQGRSADVNCVHVASVMRRLDYHYTTLSTKNPTLMPNSDHVEPSAPSPAGLEPPRKKDRRTPLSKDTTTIVTKTTLLKGANSANYRTTLKTKMPGMRKLTATTTQKTTASGSNSVKIFATKSKRTSKKSKHDQKLQRAEGLCWQLGLDSKQADPEEICYQKLKHQSTASYVGGHFKVFQQRALAERARDADGPRKVTVNQFKNKLDAVRAGYKAKRLRMLATENRT
ncbi:LOW QUALITY PROTEIN: hypothetical protein PHMEG_00025525 [Phytophthora megakarya]|uniref:Uncharacterized protein n=1 Tax=Phytophthora megakarya TaxID=4795 RepID=A0A225VDH6_9STRA|nr:LOW QUALITY PROTEIN: hypothetical protein PHMEG_00025525 [Phytophthora megakarya]